MKAKFTAADVVFGEELSAVSDILTELSIAAAGFGTLIKRLNGAHNLMVASMRADIRGDSAAEGSVAELRSSRFDGSHDTAYSSEDSDYDPSEAEPYVPCPGRVLTPDLQDGQSSTRRAPKSKGHDFDTERSDRPAPERRHSKLSSWSVGTTTSQGKFKSGFSRVTKVRRISKTGQFVGQVKLRSLWRDVDPDLMSCVAASSKWEVVNAQTSKSLISTFAGMSETDLRGLKGDGRRLCSIAHPGGPTRLAWSGLCLALITWDIVAIPMQAFSTFESIAFTCLEWSTTVIWTLDMLFNFRTGYFAGTKLEMRTRKIARHYLLTWFSLDLFLVMSEWIGRFTSVMAPASLLRTSRILRTVRFIKLVRLAKMQNIWMHVKEQINSNTCILIFNMTLLTFALMLCVHLMACLWYALGEREHDGWTTYEAYSGHKGVGFWYLASTRWVIAQVNGRTDDDDRRNMLERGYACFVGITMAVIAKALFTSIITKTVLELSQLTSEKTRRRRLVNSYLEAHRLSSTIIACVKRHLHEYQDPEKEQARERHVLAILPRHLKSELLLEVRAPRLVEHPLFSNMSSGSSNGVRQVCQNAVVLVTPLPYEVVFDKGDPCSRLLFVDRGSLTYGDPFASDEVDTNWRRSVARDPLGSDSWESKAAVTPGDWISEPSLWIEWNACGRLVSDEYTCLYAVAADELATTLKDDSSEFATTVLYARRFTEELAHMHQWSDIVSFEIKFVSHNARSSDVQVTIISATGLSAADPNLLGGKADPYCICRVGWDAESPDGKQIKTNVVSNSLEPIWNYKGKLTYTNIDLPLVFEVWDKDTFTEDDFLGRASIEFCHFRDTAFDGDIPLRGPKANGSLKVNIAVLAASDRFPIVPAALDEF